jgi:hypothetical protein
MWNTAQAWRLVTHDPFERLTLPKRTKPNVRFFTADKMRRIIEAASEPYETLFWLAAETGMRGELVDSDGGRWWALMNVSCRRGNLYGEAVLENSRLTLPPGGSLFSIGAALAARLHSLRA